MAGRTRLEIPPPQLLLKPGFKAQQLSLEESFIRTASSIFSLLILNLNRKEKSGVEGLLTLPLYQNSLGDLTSTLNTLLQIPLAYGGSG